MFNSKRLGKRSIVGSKVCAKNDSGWYQPALIKSIQRGPDGNEVYYLKFSGANIAQPYMVSFSIFIQLFS